jgi:TMEM175 potassium channel family protein
MPVQEDDDVTASSGSTRAERRRDPSRVLALTDGVFAIIITLLVLDIHVPELSAHEKLGTAISDVRPSFISFTIAFIVAAMQWTGHRDLFTLIRYTDRGIIWLNLLTLFAVCLLPFGTALLSHYYEDPLALRMFGLILMGTSVARTAIWAYATHRPALIHEPLDRASIRSGLALSILPLAVYLAAFAIAGASPQASLGVYALGPVLYFIAITLLHVVAPRGSAERQFT